MPAITASIWYGGVGTDVDFGHETGTLGAGAASSTLHLRLNWLGSVYGFDQFYFDDFAIGCLP